MPSAKRLIKFCWILPAVYVIAFVVLLLGTVSGAGHTPRSFEFLTYVLGWPLYLLDFVVPRFEMQNPLLGFILSLLIGLLTYAVLGLLIDVAVLKLRRRRS